MELFLFVILKVLSTVAEFVTLLTVLHSQLVSSQTIRYERSVCKKCGCSRLRYRNQKRKVVNGHFCIYSELSDTDIENLMAQTLKGASHDKRTSLFS